MDILIKFAQFGRHLGKEKITCVFGIIHKNELQIV